MIVILQESVNVLKRPSEDKILAYLNKDDILFLGKNFTVGSDKWIKIEFCRFVGYIKNAKYREIPVAVLRNKEKKIYSSPKLNSQISFILNDFEPFFLLDTFQSEDSVWHRIMTCNTRLEGYFCVSKSSIKSSEKDYKIIKNSFRTYFSYISSRAFRTNVRTSHWLGLLPGICIISIVILLKDRFNSFFIYILLAIAFFLLLVFPLFFNWIYLKYMK